MINGNVGCVVLLLGVTLSKQEVTRSLIHIGNSLAQMDIQSSFTNIHVSHFFIDRTMKSYYEHNEECKQLYPDHLCCISESESVLFAKCAQAHKEFVVVFKKLLVHTRIHTYIHI